MDQYLLNLIKSNHDAYYVNRGFYYQYLKVLQKWIQHYISDRDVAVFTEVGNDIKEVGDKLVYTQIKCYTKLFSLQNTVLTKELFTFYVQFLEEKHINPELEFHFSTNTSIIKSETLLAAWIKAQPLQKGELLDKCVKKVKEILKKELKKLCISKSTAKRITADEKAKIKSGFTQLASQLDSVNLLADFVERIQWHFGEETPLESILALHHSILNDLKHEKFEGKPPGMLLEAFLSEINHRSQLDNSEYRKVDNQLMKLILSKKDDEINNCISESLIRLLDVRFFALEGEVTQIREKVDLLDDIIVDHSQQIKSLIEEAEKNNHSVYPHDLTLIPYISSIEAIGKSNELLELHTLLLENKFVCLSGNGGIGKSTLAKLYINTYRNFYDTMLWVDVETGIFENFIFNQTLSDTLGISKELTSNDKFSNIVQKLNTIKGKGLIVLNDLTSDEKDILEQLKSLYNWHIIITTRIRIEAFKEQKVNPLSFKYAVELYRKFETDNSIDDSIFNKFFELIEYNTLTIVLVAKTVHLSLDHTLENFLTFLLDQRLDDEEMDIDIELGNTSFNLLNILQKTFNLNFLEDSERFSMELFALLPAEGIAMIDLVQLYGKENEKKNIVDFTRIVNQLHKKGLITRTGNHIKMDMIFQETVLYQLRKEKSSFLSQMFNIPFLAARIREGADGDPAKAVKFMKYGQSFVKKIKEDSRVSIYQPMLQLENEVLNIMSWIQTSKNLVENWENLTSRAVKFLDANNLLLGIIFHNYGIALASGDDRKKASKYFEKSITIFKSASGNGQETHLLNMMCNKAHLYLQLNDYQEFGRTFQEISDLRNSFKLWHDKTMPLQCHLMGTAYKKNRNFSVAKKMFSMAVNAHQELPSDQRNDLNLVIYLCDLAFCFIAEKDLESAEKSAIWAVNILHRLKLGSNNFLIGVIEIFICIADEKGDTALSKRLRQNLQNLID